MADDIDRRNPGGSDWQVEKVRPPRPGCFYSSSEGGAMTPIDHIYLDKETLKLRVCDKSKMLCALIKSFNSKGLQTSNGELAKVLCCSPDHVGKLLTEIKPYIRVENSQSRYRRIFYSGQNDEVEAKLHRQKRRSKNKSTPSFRTSTQSKRTATPAEMTDKTELIKQTKNNIYCHNSIEYKLSELLLNLILERKQDFKMPNLQSWPRHINLMIRRDGRKPERIREVVEWCQADSFWQVNILSTQKLREKFDTLELQKNAQSKKRNPNNRSSFVSQKSNIGETIAV